ncbi:hypothetical protein KDL01_33830 [Actinospica durhamensis]|uniref:Uncharacterized protein n=1 Tax=Actinospica durhamensis TaxID=1508375 RepID=A0A941EZR8_9ACTN|nr:hypothetical protein [Actinospica durhamensis]MBR7838299.1 hypothetical protein [Actinospica durhamensis]
MSAETLDGATRLTLRPLSITPHGDGDGTGGSNRGAAGTGPEPGEIPGEIMVGDAARGEFVVLPAVAGPVIAALAAGRSLDEAAADVLASTGVEVDVADFAAALIDLGFVARVGDRETAAGAPRGEGTGGRWGAAAVRVFGPAFARALWPVYALVGAVDVAAVAGDRALRPAGGQLYFLPDPLAGLALLTLTQMCVAAGHESAHWIAARRAGVPSRIGVGRRGYLLVLQTDLSALRAVPRRARFAPLCAGLAFDSCVLAVNLALRQGARDGWWHLPPTLLGFLAGQAAMQVLAMALQLLIFLRSDLYGALVLGFDCVDLSRVARLTLRARLGRYGRLGPDERAVLARADRRDLRVARWYSWLLGIGAVLAAFCFAGIVVPGIWRVCGWVRTALADHPVASTAFWEPVGCAVILLLPSLLPWVLALRERRARSA